MMEILPNPMISVKNNLLLPFPVMFLPLKQSQLMQQELLKKFMSLYKQVWMQKN